MRGLAIPERSESGRAAYRQRVTCPASRATGRKAFKRCCRTSQQAARRTQSTLQSLTWLMKARVIGLSGGTMMRSRLVPSMPLLVPLGCEESRCGLLIYWTTRLEIVLSLCGMLFGITLPQPSKSHTIYHCCCLHACNAMWCTGSRATTRSRFSQRFRHQADSRRIVLVPVISRP